MTDEQTVVEPIFEVPAHLRSQGGELRGFKFQSLLQAPDNISEAGFYYDGVTHRPKYHNGTTIVEFGRVYSQGNGIDIKNDEISIDEDIFTTGFTKNNGVISVKDYSQLIKNTSTTYGNIGILGGIDDNSYVSNAVSIGVGANVVGDSYTHSNYSTAIGAGAYVNGDYAIQLGKGVNSTAKTLAVGFDNDLEYTLLDGATGLIPDARLSSNIARSADIPTQASDIDALPDTTKYGKTIDVSLNTTDYKLTISLKDQDGTVLNSKVVDFPVESVVVSGAYDSANKKIVLTLVSGATIDVPVGDLIAGLQTEITSSNKLDSDLVDDTNSAHKFATSSQLTQIATNATDIGNIQLTLNGFGNIVTHNVNEFATASQGAKADTACQKIAVYNTALPESNNICTWTIPNTLETDDVTVNIYEVNNGVRTVIYPPYTVTSSSITINILSDSDIDANTLRAVITG